MQAGAWTTLAGLGLTAVALTVVSALGRPLGLPTFLLGLLTAAAVLAPARAAPWPMLKAVSWGVLPLAGGLFVLVQALQDTGLTTALAGGFVSGLRTSPQGASWAAGGLVALVSNLVNNLPVGLISNSVASAAHPPAKAIDALLIGVDLGPNLSVAGSLATLLWLAALRREGEDVSFWRFLRTGALVAPPALAAALAARLLLPG